MGSGASRPTEARAEASLHDHPPVRIGVGGSREVSTSRAVEAAHRAMLSRLEGASPLLVVATCTSTHAVEDVAEALQRACPETLVVGCSTCQGAIVNDSWLSATVVGEGGQKDSFACALWGLSDAGGACTVVHLADLPSSMDVKSEVREEVAQALIPRPDAPSFVLLLGCAGFEEAVLAGITGATAAPVVGGTAADNQVAGDWWQLAKMGSAKGSVGVAGPPTVSYEGVAVALVWCSCEVASTMVSGYSATACRGVVTELDGGGSRGRNIAAIDGRAAATVYDEWTGGEVMGGVPFTGEPPVANLLASSACAPLGVATGGDAMRVLHPAFANGESGALSVFSEVGVGEQVLLLQSSKSELGRRVVESTRETVRQRVSFGVSGGGIGGGFEADSLAGALVIVCGGLVMAIGDDISLAAEQLAGSVSHRNTLGLGCFGEQGSGPDGVPFHGNLMCGCLLISHKRRAIARPPPNPNAAVTSRSRVTFGASTSACRPSQSPSRKHSASSLQQRPPASAVDWLTSLRQRRMSHPAIVSLQAQQEAQRCEQERCEQERRASQGLEGVTRWSNSLSDLSGWQGGERPLPERSSQAGSWAEERPLRVLSLDGGGVRGVNLVLMLQAIEAQAGGVPIGALFDLICGTSVGGAIAVVCASVGAEGCARALNLIDSGMRSCFSKGSVQNLVLSGHRIPARHQTQFLRTDLVQALELAATVDPLPRRGAERRGCGAAGGDYTVPHCCVVATRLSGTGGTPMCHVLTNYSASPAGSDEWPAWKAVGATTAAPTCFREIEHGDAWFVDGGVVANNPALQAVEQAHALWPGRQIGLLLSLGGGHSVYGGTGGKHGSGVMHWVSTMLTLAFDAAGVDKTVRELQSALNIASYVRLSPPCSLKLDETRPEKLQEMTEGGAAFIADRAALFAALGRYVTAKTADDATEAAAEVTRWSSHFDTLEERTTGQQSTRGDVSIAEKPNFPS